MGTGSGRRTTCPLVSSDNDLTPSLATQIYAFAIDPKLISYEPQVLHAPFFPPGQLKKVTE